MVAGAAQIKIHGGWFPVRAQVHGLDALSAHADAGELLDEGGALAGGPRIERC